MSNLQLLHMVVRTNASANTKCSVPADRVYVPDPQSYFQSARSAMSKPTSSKAFKPINTISDVNRGPGGARQVTYGRASRQLNASIGKERHAGQLAFLKSRQGSSATGPLHDSPTRKEHTTSLDDVPLSKRRKTVCTEPDDVIDLRGEDDVQDSPVGYQQPRSRDGVSGAARNNGGLSTALQMSEFEEIDRFFTSNRKKNTTPGRQSDYRSPPSATRKDRIVTSSTAPRRTSSISTDDNEPARKAILKDFQQGIMNQSPKKHRVENKYVQTTSHHFRNARINESTKEAAEIPGRRSSRKDDLGHNLRTFRRTEGTKSLGTSVSDAEDELAMDESQQKLPLTKTSHVATRTGKCKTNPASGWKLVFARTHEYSYSSSEIEDGHSGVFLQQDKDTRTWRIIGPDPESGVPGTRASFSSNNINKVQSDGVRRVRLEGPRMQDSNICVVDLHFSDLEECSVFCNQYAKFWTVSQTVQARTEDNMSMIFSKALTKNDKVGASPLVPDARPESEQTKNQAKTFPDGALWTRMKASPDKSDSITAADSRVRLTNTANASSASTRPVRSTRATGLILDQEEDCQNEKISRYSVDVGLGPPWLRPLTYGDGRQKATVYFDDLHRLDEEEFLNDSLIDFYMIYLFDRHQVPRDKVFFFNTYFYTQLTKNTGRAYVNYKAVERWTSKVDIFSYDYVVVPINEATHWFLAIICNVGNIDRKPVEEDFDSTTADTVADLDSEQPLAAELVETEALNIARTPGTPPTLAETSGEQDGGDVNLFDELEKSKLDLIDREDQGSKDDVSHDLVPAEIDAQQELQVLSAQETVPTTVLSNLKASPGKRKTKRKPVIPKRDPTQPVVVILDSLSSTRSSTVRALKDWLVEEGKAKRGMEAVIKEKGFYPKASQIPTQTNFSDCGVYLLGYADEFFRDPDAFKNKLLTGEMTAVHGWPDLQPKEMRTNLRNIIFKLASEQRLTEKKGKKKKKDVSLLFRTSVSNEVDAKPVELSSRQSTSCLPESLEDRKPAFPTVLSSKKESPQSNGQSLDETRTDKMPRLGSPFSPKSYPKPLSSTTTPDLNDKAPGPSQIADLSTQNHIDPPRHEGGLRKNGPEVRVPVKAPKTQLDERRHLSNDVLSNGTATLSSAKDNSSRQPVKSSPPERHRHNRRSSPIARRHREGSLDHPIEIQDSQEVQAGAASPRQVQLTSPRQRRQRIQSSKPGKSLGRVPSLEEISRPSVNSRPRLRRQAEEQQLPEVMEIDAQEVGVVETPDVEMQDADDVIRETPEAQRRSPQYGGSIDS